MSDKDSEDESPREVESPDSPGRELLRASRALSEAAETRPVLKLLLLVDPVRAFEDAGIVLSKYARKMIRRNYPNMAYGNTELYEGVRSGKVRLERIREVRLGRPRSRLHPNGDHEEPGGES